MRIRPESFGFTLLLGALAALPPLSIDMGLPALPLLESYLGASPEGAGLTLSLFLAGFAASQLVLGPLSDRIGRRPVMLGGLTLYTLAGVGCAASPSIGALILWRLLQGAGAAAATVLAFVVVRDLFEGAIARVRFSYVTMVLSVAPIVAPTLGGWVLALAGWRGIYAFLALTGAILAIAAALGLSETRPPGRRQRVLRSYRKVLRHRRVRAYAAVNACNFAGLFAYISGSPLVLMGALHVGPQIYGALFACTAAAIMAGAWLSGRLALRGIPAGPPLLAGLCVDAAASTALVVISWALPLSLAVLMPLLIAHTFCRGLVGPNAVHSVLDPMPELAGAAAAVNGSLQMLAGALASGAVAVLFPPLGARAMPVVMLVCAVLALAVWSTTLVEPAPATKGFGPSLPR
jgi:DHA1 family bicyclomycin/chloramphenicol resistance-like MFS transporter